MKKKMTVPIFFALLMLVCTWSTSDETFEKQTDTNVYTRATTTNSSVLYDVSKQEEIEAAIEEKKRASTYSEASPLFIYNPFGTNTTLLYTYFTTSKPTKVSYTIHVDLEGVSDTTKTVDVTYELEHEYQLVGLIPDTTNTITFYLEYQDGEITSYTYTYSIQSIKNSDPIQTAKT